MTVLGGSTLDWSLDWSTGIYGPNDNRFRWTADGGATGFDGADWAGSGTTTVTGSAVVPGTGLVEIYAQWTAYNSNQTTGVLSGSVTAPITGVAADWAGDGFGATGSLDDITTYVKSWRITRGASPEITGGATPGAATLTLNNTGDRFNPLNTGGTLYGSLTDGVPIWISVNSDGAATGSDPRGLFGGRIRDITPIPVPGAAVAPQVEITCEDALAWYDRVPVRVEDSRTRSHAALRQAMLDAAGETRYSLASEIHTMPLSSWDGSLAAGLEQINRANGTRHFVQPADTASAWYTYTTRNRQWRLDATTDGTVDAGSDHVTDTSGWRLSADTVINQQKATVTPVTFTPGAVTVWESARGTLPMVIDSERVIWVEFDAFVDSPVANYTYTGTAPTVTLEPFGNTAKLTLDTAGTTTFTRLTIEGSMARYGANESVVVDDTASQAGSRGVRAGNEISGPFVGVIASARGIADHVVWRYATPQFRPTLTVKNWIPEMSELDLYDLIAVTVAELGMTARLFEIVGLTLESDFAPDASSHLHVATYVLQECAVQSDPGWFTWDTSTWNGADVLAY